MIGLIPARGGSKGIPRKNLVPLGGKPLLNWSIQVGLASDLDRVIVSTDDEYIAEVAKSCGAEVPFLRPGSLAEDETPDLPVFQHLLAELDRIGDVQPDAIVHLRPTSPARTPDLVRRAMDEIVAHPEADSVRSVSLAPHTPYKMWTIKEDGSLTPLLGSFADELYNRPRQSLPSVWWHDGVIDVVRASVVLGGSMTGRHIRALETPAELAVDIDVPVDLAGAEVALQRSGLLEGGVQ